MLDIELEGSETNAPLLSWLIDDEETLETELVEGGLKASLLVLSWLIEYTLETELVEVGTNPSLLVLSWLDG